jgi:hypothetical protein
MHGLHLQGRQDVPDGQRRVAQILPSECIGGILLEAIGDLTVAVLRREKGTSA